MSAGESMSASGKPDIFIAGAPRSGTTILQKILCSSRYTNPLMGEAQHFLNLVQAYDSAVHLFDTKTKFYFTKEELFQYHKKIAEEYIDRIRSNLEQDNRLVLKCPGYSKYFPHLANFLPRAQFVLIVRDTLDIVASQIEVGERQSSAKKNNDFPREYIQQLAKRINAIYLTFVENKRLFEGRLISVRYEKLVAGEKAVKRLAEFLYLPDLENISGAKYEGMKDFQRDTDGEYYSKYWEQDVTDSRIGRYKEILTTREIETVKKATRNLRDMFGYD